MANGMDSSASPFLTNEVAKLMKALDALNESWRLPYIIFSLTLRSLHEISYSMSEQEISPTVVAFPFALKIIIFGCCEKKN
jgi:hypothetical protein